VVAFAALGIPGLSAAAGITPLSAELSAARCYAGQS
jgi:hypothetical protein